MERILNAVVIMARCAINRQGYGIRLEEKSKNYWEADWAFTLKEKAAAIEGYEGSTISGTFCFAAEYPGCPHCGSRSIFKCGCGKVACWNGEIRQVTCPWCGNTAELAGEIKTLSADSDR